MTARISLLLPTRGRPVLALRFLDSVVKRCERPDLVEVVVHADDDDPQSHELRAEGLSVRTLIGPRTSMGGYNTACFENSSGDIVVLANDDVVIQTPGWDRRLREMDLTVRDGIYLAYPNDLFKGSRVCTFPILSRSTCKLLGEPFPRAYQGAFIDYHLLDIFKRLERRGYPRLIYLEDVVFEHMHYRTGKGNYDEVYRKRNRFADDDTFLQLRDNRSAAAQRLFDAVHHESAVPRGTQLAKASSAVGMLAVTLLDRELPISWRLRLFFWFLARSVARLVLSAFRFGNSPAGS